MVGWRRGEQTVRVGLPVCFQLYWSLANEDYIGSFGADFWRRRTVAARHAQWTWPLAERRAEVTANYRHSTVLSRSMVWI